MQQHSRHSNLTRRLVSLGLFAGAALLMSVSAQAASSNGPYYADPAWDQKLPGATRFVLLTDWNSEAVLDRETGLVWEQDPGPAKFGEWNKARLTCANKTVGGRKGWRLPSMPELASLVDPSVASPGPILPAGHPFTGVQKQFFFNALYWSATTDAADPQLAWVVDFGQVFVGNFLKVETFSLVWCVRGAMNADKY